MRVSLRPLQEADAKISCRWRNNPDVWRFTGNKPDTHVTEAIELAWIRQALNNPCELRFAICAGDSCEYVGNAQLTNITKGDAEFHIFIGEIAWHGRGVGSFATQQVLQHAHTVLGLNEIYLHVHADNAAAITAYLKCGFKFSYTGEERSMRQMRVLL